MKIVDKTIKDSVQFKDVKIADAFRLSGELFLKTGKCYCNGEEAIANAVGLENGTFYFIRDDETVEVLDAEVVIK